MNLNCLHLHQYATVARPYPKHYLAFALPIPTPASNCWAPARLALFASIHQLIVSHLYLNRIPGVLRVGVGAGGGTVAGASAGVLAQAVRRQAVLGQAVLGQAVLGQAVLGQTVRRHQAEVAAPK